MKAYAKKVGKTLLLGLAILAIGLIFVSINNQKKELPDGILMSRNRFNGQISLKMPNNEFTHFQKDNPFYKEMLDLFNNH